MPDRSKHLPETITYNLRAGGSASDAYFRAVAHFTDRALAETEARAGALLDAFQAHLTQRKVEPLRTREEYAFEVLSLGVLWRVYLAPARRSARAPQRLLAALVALRKRSACLKPGVDLARGLLASLCLYPRAAGEPAGTAPGLGDLERLLGWLAASGEFTEETRRLRTWGVFLSTLPPAKAARALETAACLAEWFEAASLEALGGYTAKVERFLAETHPAYRWREDVVFCGRKRLEYHLNMVGTETMNRAFREQFLSAPRKVVFVPPCMCARREGDCQARATPLGARCAGCTPGCRVHQVTRLGEVRGFEVFIIPDELSVASPQDAAAPHRPDIGLVGVSCPLTNTSGGWETRRLGIPSQGLPLDYCGCVWHWHPEGIVTDINLDQLLEILGLPAKVSRDPSSRSL